MNAARQWMLTGIHALLGTLLLQSTAAARAAAPPLHQGWQNATHSHTNTPADYSTLGPCLVAEQPLDPLVLPEQSGCGSFCSLSPRLHLPVPPNSGTHEPPSEHAQANITRCSTAPLPTVFFFSGFQLTSSYYTPYARWLASWGYACVQYDLALLHVVPDAVEVGYLPYLLDHLEHHPSTRARLDLTGIGTAGHSRGGKLAALHLAGNPRVVAAFLVDPVDSGGTSSVTSSSRAVASDTGPSAVQELSGKHKQAAIAGAGVSGPCNPQQRSYHAFFDVLGPGSWLEVVPAGGHMQFTAATSSIIGRVLDWLCHAGHTSHEHVIELAAPALIAWMEAHIKNQTALPIAAQMAGQVLPVSTPLKVLDPAALVSTRRGTQRPGVMLGLQAFFRWVKKKQATGEITFEVKQEKRRQPCGGVHGSAGSAAHGGIPPCSNMWM